ncbi:MAG: hypothetical protein Q9209_000702 [Squamulea sp. 1 TL-2023]
MYCNNPGIGPNAASLHETLDQSQAPWSEYPSPCRNPESPLDQRDLDRFQRRTAKLVTASIGYSQDIGVNTLAKLPRQESTATVSDSPLLPNPQSLLKLCQRFEIKLAHLELAKEELLKSFELDVQEMRSLLMELSGTTTTADIDSPAKNSPCSEVSLDSDTVYSLPSSPSATPQDITTEAMHYTQNWHNGGLIIVENLSEKTRTRDIHGLFQSCGTVTYLELHGADKSKPHVNTRYAYIHFAEYNQAICALQDYHGTLFQGRKLMVFIHSKLDVRGEPGKPYHGSALEILNFAGGQNYASPEADYLQDANEDLQQLLNDLDTTTPQHSDLECSTYSLKPNLNGKTTASWRRTEAPNAEGAIAPSIDATSEEADIKTLRQPSNASNLNLVEMKPLPVGQPGAYIPPVIQKRRGSAIADTYDASSRQPDPAMRILKRAEPLPADIFRSGMVNREERNFQRLAVEDFLVKGKPKVSPSQQAVIDDDVDDEEGGVLL